MPTRTPRKPSRSKPSRRAGTAEPPQSVQLAGETFIILPEREYLRLRALAGELTQQDLGDIAEAARRRNEPARPYAELRKELGLA